MAYAFSPPSITAVYSLSSSIRAFQLVEPDLGFCGRRHIQEEPVLGDLGIVPKHPLNEHPRLPPPIYLVPDMSQGLFGLNFFICSMIKGAEDACMFGGYFMDHLCPGRSQCTLIQ